MPDEWITCPLTTHFGIRWFDGEAFLILIHDDVVVAVVKLSVENITLLANELNQVIDVMHIAAGNVRVN